MMEIALTSLDNQQLFTLASRVETLLGKQDTSALGIKPYADKFLSRFSDYKTSFEKQSLNTEQIAQKDGERDNMYIALRNHIRNYHYHPESDKKEKARKLLSVLNQHGQQVYSESYSVETAALEAIISEFDKNQLPVLEELRATEWFTNLKNAQADFEKTVLGHTELKAESAKIDSATKSRSGLVDALRKLFLFMPLHYEMTQSAPLGSLIDQLQIESDRI
ncbi:MAG: hypothetical protein HC819_14295 [Cyclobacteriaceae bacterium]|nr:hypothetical protein [Cyclobacteriaceae bacterium]